MVWYTIWENDLTSQSLFRKLSKFEIISWKQKLLYLLDGRRGSKIIFKRRNQIIIFNKGSNRSGEKKKVVTIWMILFEFKFKYKVEILFKKTIIKCFFYNQHILNLSPQL